MDVLPKSLSMTAAFEWPKPGKRQEYLRARVIVDEEGQSAVEIFSHQGSGVLTSTSWAEGLVMIPVGATVKKGDKVSYTPFTELL
jgi:molybdopterin molybdotransferase